MRGLRTSTTTPSSPTRHGDSGPLTPPKSWGAFWLWRCHSGALARHGDSGPLTPPKSSGAFWLWRCHSGALARHGDSGPLTPPKSSGAFWLWRCHSGERPCGLVGAIDPLSPCPLRYRDESWKGGALCAAGIGDCVLDTGAAPIDFPSTVVGFRRSSGNIKERRVGKNRSI